LGDWVDVLDAGVVHQDVDVESQIVQRRAVEQIQVPGGPADRGGHLGGAHLVDVGHGDGRAEIGELPGTGGPDPAGPAGDQRRPPDQRRHVCAALSSRALSSAPAPSTPARSIPLVSRAKPSAISVTTAAPARYSAIGTAEEYTSSSRTAMIGAIEPATIAVT